MCKIGIISDVHGDLDAIKMALQLFSARGVSQILCAGDTVEKGPHDDEVVMLLSQKGIPCAQGNHDENAIRHHELNQAMESSVETQLLHRTIEYLRQLPIVFEVEVTEVKILVCHATPSDNGGRVFHAEGGNRLSKRFKKDIARSDCNVMIVGHTHSPFDIHFGGKKIINPGATCKLKERDSHSVGILELPELKFCVFGLKDGKEIHIPTFVAS